MCSHRVCHRGEGTYCVSAAIAAARRLRQLDGEVPDERGDRVAGIEYALTIEQIAKLEGITTRAVELLISRALRKLRADPLARELVSLLGA